MQKNIKKAAHNSFNPLAIFKPDANHTENPKKQMADNPNNKLCTFSKKLKKNIFIPLIPF